MWDTAWRVFWKPNKPIREIALLHNGQDTWTNRTLHANQVLPVEPSGRVFHIQAKLSIPEGAKLRFNLRGVPVVLTSNERAVRSNDEHRGS